ncbi:threonine--tRNA ligase [Bacillus paranthracis]|jgi:threonyl-tRNA synthetase|uniref:Threonine--tRNA ligase n=4 Tax=Bacillus cereus group TaxID=86661 RepID=A0A5M9GWL7_9BACI|nr:MULTISPECIES: threonine--tRNA ligase [Bacillus]ACJ78710.1 threonyl-tRNA synthetase [Bacillus cereus AH187]ACM14806.1 threonyl-tRNA synthetase [Bacillus cereus Q1]EEK98375.1 Threonyl-tRNA synthetase [Bacillus cereus BDRD-ST26]EJP93477.1 threonyl-tRNA synthetase [Bacillus cereus IS075]EJQ04486.1 threonyl-tRNA synthetase [Bacillus cereus AND1407]EJR10269.1 threonyl-tRNA synthetase [Bacillus cereus MSX-A12]EOO93403.1 threonyl-tRNA synthetase [Bacillus cereus IS845/00]EOO98894.1 threonyl-tRNA
MADVVKITFPDGAVKEFPKGVTTEEIAASISPGLKKKAVAGKLNDEMIDLVTPIEEDGAVSIITLDSEDGLYILRHSTAHLLAQALKRLYKDVKVELGIGPVIENGFYYDIDMEEAITVEDFKKIEKEMQKIVNENLEIVRHEVPRAEAIRRFEEIGDELKLDLINDLPEDAVISIYEQGEFFDLCRGVHLPSTGKIKVFKLLSVAGAYWRGDSNNKMLQRIYGTAFVKKAELDEHLRMLEEAKERDHRKLGKELKLFTNSQKVGQGLPLWLPKGATIRRIIERYIVDKEASLGYDHVYTPVLGSRELYETSGHWNHYRDGMFPSMEMDNEELVLRPMNCPHHMMVYKNDIHSYRELPIRIAELGTMHRYEMSGALSGLQRVRGMTLNDAHIFVRPDQIKEELKRVVNLTLEVYKDFGLENYSFRLSYRDPADTKKYYADDEMWEKAQGMLKEAMDEMGLDYYEAEGEAAFYGPKLDVQVRTALGKDETLSTVQLDFLLPERFELSYVGEDGKQHRPVVIHRGVVSTMERFVAFLIEEYKGAFPTWLAPVQVQVIPVSPQVHLDYAKKVQDELRRAGMRVELDTREEKIGYKIREAQMQKIPYMLVVGDNEVTENGVNVRKYGEQKSETIALDAFVDMIKVEGKR